VTHRVGLAVIGCGDVATTRHLPAIVADTGARLVACCDRDPNRAAAAAAKFGADYATTAVEKVLTDPGVRAVIVATPPWVTPGITIAALDAGKDVLAEKPVALTLDEALAVQTAERRSDQFVQVGFVMRHGPVFGAMQRWIATGRLGSPLDFRVGIFDETWDPVGNPEHYQRILATLNHGAPCIHDGAHTMDHLHFLTGKQATSLVSWGRTTRSEFPRPNLNLAVIDFAGGHRARVEIGWFLPQFPPIEWSVVGPLGMAWCDLPQGCAHLRTADGDEDVRVDEDWFENCFRHQLDVFLTGVRTRVSPQPGTQAGIDSLVLTHAFEQGMAGPAFPRTVEYP
jgi:predicted dehydrogenase